MKKVRKPNFEERKDTLLYAFGECFFNVWDTNFWPNDPVPPVIKIVEFLIIFSPYLMLVLPY